MLRGSVAGGMCKNDSMWWCFVSKDGKAKMTAQRNSIRQRSEMERRNHATECPPKSCLAGAARHGSAGSFEALCAPHAKRLLQTALSITGNREDAEDAVQDALMRAFLGINDFRGISSFSTWLTRIVINSALMIRRKSRTARYVFLDDVSEDGEHRSKLDVPCAAPDPAQVLIIRERRKALRDAIAGLRPPLRSVIEAGHLKGFSMKETAKVLNISIGAAKTRLFHARAALRRSTALRGIAQSRTKPAA